MAGLRPFTREDAAATADLYLRSYRDRSSPAPEAMARYFTTIYCENPWLDPELPSWVFQEDDGAITGFLGIVPRPMTFRGRPIRAAVLSTVMVDPSRRGRSIGRQLMEQGFDGPQDLFYTDGANAASQRLWKACGGAVALLSSCHWQRVLRPGSHLASLVGGSGNSHGGGPRRWLGLGLKPPAVVVDALAVRAPRGPTRLPADSAVGEPATAERILECRGAFDDQPALAPVYDPERFAWLLEQTAGATRRGRLESILVRDRDGTPLGWFVAFARSGGTAEVLQLGGSRATIPRVLAHLFHRAWKQGAIALRGQFEPRYVVELDRAHCGFTFNDIGVLVHSRDENITAAIHRGDAALSRLDGEWWLHFSDDPWT